MRRPRRKEIQGSIEMEDGLLIYAAGGGTVISLNGSARAVWELCDGARTEEEIGRVLAGELGLAEAGVEETELEELAGDIRRALEQLEQAGLIEWMEE